MCGGKGLNHPLVAWRDVSQVNETLIENTRSFPGLSITDSVQTFHFTHEYSIITGRDALRQYHLLILW